MHVLEACVVFLAVVKLIMKMSGNLKGKLLLLNITGIKRLDIILLVLGAKILCDYL